MTDLALATALDNEQRDYLTMARHSAEALLDILNDILDFSKIEAGKLRVENVAYDLHEMLRTTVRTMALRADPDRVTVSVDLDPTLPQVVVGDPGRFRQVVVNLVGNAIKFTQRGSVSLEARAEPTPEGWRVVVAVADSGIGIREDKLSTIFDAFAQADSSTTRRYGGTGLGLSICKQLTALLGGEIGVTSEVGKGSRFTFDVRVRRPEPGEVPLSPSRGAVVPSVRPQRALRVLLVEDNIVNQRLALALLSRGGHEVVLARDGLEAVEAASRGEIDVILMDMQMPVLGGIEATERIRAEERREGRRRIPILALSAAAMQGDREAGLAAGMDDYLTKPVRAAELEACLLRYGKR
jgi:CheY-like chemotaxis protein